MLNKADEITAEELLKIQVQWEGVLEYIVYTFCTWLIRSLLKNFLRSRYMEGWACVHSVHLQCKQTQMAAMQPVPSTYSHM